MMQPPPAGPASAVDAGDWPTSSPDEQAMDGALLGEIGRLIDGWAEANVHAILMVRNGRRVFERYFVGEDQRWGQPLGRVAYDASMRHDLRSITKSVMSLLVGIAADRGLIADLDAPVLSFFPEYRDLRTPEKDEITVRHLLTMSTGLAWNEELPYSDPRNSERLMSEAPDLCRYVLEQPLVRRPGAVYNYNGGATALLAAIVSRVSGRSFDDWARDELLAPLGISDVEWVRYGNGDPVAASGLRLRPRDVARIGQMVLARGAWQRRRIVSSSWIEDSISPHINGLGLFFYGYQWWLGRSLVRRKEVTWAAAYGYGGQRMFVVPARNLVVLVMAGMYDNPLLQIVVGEVVLRRFALASIQDS